MYIQDKLEEYADDIFIRLSNGGHIYFCGLKVRNLFYLAFWGGFILFSFCLGDWLE